MGGGGETVGVSFVMVETRMESVGRGKGRLQVQLVGERGRGGRDQTVVNGTGELVEHRNVVLGQGGGGIRGGALRFPWSATGYNLCWRRGGRQGRGSVLFIHLFMRWGLILWNDEKKKE